MPFQIKGSRTKLTAGVNLCASCRNSLHREHDDSSTLWTCLLTDDRMWSRVLIPVTDCSRYSSLQDKTFYDYRNAAWLVVRQRDGRFTFASPAEVQQLEVPEDVPRGWFQRLRQWWRQRSRPEIIGDDPMVE